MTGDMQLGAGPPPTSSQFLGQICGESGEEAHSSGEPGGPRAAGGEAGRLPPLCVTSDLLLRACSVLPPRPQGEGELPA